MRILLNQVYPPEEGEGKFCSRCKEWKFLSEFYYRQDRKIYDSQCEDCKREVRFKNYNASILRKKLIRWNRDGFEINLKYGKGEREEVAKIMKLCGWKYNPDFCDGRGRKGIWFKPGLKDKKGKWNLKK